MIETVLVVEDNDDLRENLAFFIQLQGFEVLTASNGQEALHMIQQNGPPCLILLDLMMPVMDGWALRAELLKDPTSAQVPVVLLSGIGDIEREARALKAAGFLSKPFEPEELYRLLHAHC